MADTTSKLTKISIHVKEIVKDVVVLEINGTYKHGIEFSTKKDTVNLMPGDTVDVNVKKGQK